MAVWERGGNGCEERYREYLARRGLFFTRARALILEAVIQRDDHFSVDDLLFDMQQLGMRVSRATLYRSLAQMAAAGVLSEVDLGRGQVYYETVDHPDHEHLICATCNRVSEVSSDALTKAIQDLVDREEFAASRVKMQVFGECRECRQAAERKAKD